VGPGQEGGGHGAPCLPQGRYLPSGPPIRRHLTTSSLAGKERMPAGTAPHSQENLVSLLREAAAARKSTLLLRGLNPSECTPSPSKMPRASRPQLQNVTGRLAGKFDAAASAAVAAPEEVGARARPAEMSCEGDTVEQAVRGAASESELRERLLASQEEVQRLQRTLQSEQDAARGVSAQLSEAGEAQRRLETQIQDLQVRLEEQTKCASDAAEALRLQQGSFTDAQLQEFADEMEEIQEKLAASEQSNAQLQSEWEDVQQELRDEIVELKSKLAASQEATTDAEENCRKKERVLRDELEKLKGDLACSHAGLDRAEDSRLKEVAELQSKIVALEEAGRELEAVAEQEVEELKSKLAELEESNKVLVEAKLPLRKGTQRHADR
jgi:chromosome segregation ATPase